MTEVLHANVFFFVTGIAVIVISVILCILLYHFIRALKSIRRILGSIERGTEAISDDMQNIRSYFARGGLIGGLLSILRGVGGSAEAPKKRRRKTRKKNELKIKDVTR
jgi:hypothetical protein